MTNFPSTEPDITALADRMLHGYMWHDTDFPRVNRMKLLINYRAYLVDKWSLDSASAKLKIESKAAEKGLQILKQVMKNCLQKSEVDTAGNPEKLKEIGWGPRTQPQPAQLPNQPTDLQLIAKEDKKVKLQWERPADNQPVRNYVIGRRQANGEGISNWSMLQICYDTQITLRNQPLGIQLEYRIRAANTAGTGPFSNTISVIL
jgi:hypothetical protein